MQLLPHQLRAWQSNRRVISLVGGCLGGEVEISTSSGLRPISQLAGSVVEVQALNGEESVWAPALVFHKGYAPLFRVEHEAGSFTATADHRCLVETDGVVRWRRVDQIQPGADRLLRTSPSSVVTSSYERQPEFAASHPLTTAGTSLSVRTTDVLHWSGTVVGSRDRCSEDLRLHDGQLHPAAGVAQECLPSRVGVHESVQPYRRQGAQASREEHIPACRSFDLPSNLDWMPLEIRGREWSESYGWPVASQWLTGNTPDVRRFLDLTVLEQQGWQFDPSRDQSHHYGEPLGFPFSACVDSALTDEHRAGQQFRHHTSPVLQDLELGLPVGLSSLASDGPSKVLSVRFERVDDYFDMSVASYHTYGGNGVWHHNTGSGKCVSPSSNVVLANGSVSRADALIGTSFRVMTVANNRVKSTEARAEWNITEPVFRVTTDHGRIAERNFAHPLWSRQGWKPTGKIVPGDHVAVPCHTPTGAGDEVRHWFESVRVSASTLTAGLPDGLAWERVASVVQLPDERTVAICVPKYGNYLTDFWEHNTWFGPMWCYRKLNEKPGNRVLCIGTGYERHVSRVMMHEIVKMLKTLNQKFNLNERKGELTLANGSACLFGSSENALCFDSQTEILTDKGWVNGLDLTPDHLVAQSTRDGDVSLVKPTKIIQQDYVGPMVDLHGRSLSMMVTPNHRLPTFATNGKYREFTAQDFVPTKSLGFRKTFSFSGGTQETVRIGSHEFPVDTWAAFLGWYISEGSARRDAYNLDRGNYQINISQVKLDNRILIAKDLAKLGLTVHESGISYIISNKEVWAHLHPLGKQPDRYLPRYCFDLPRHAQVILLDRLIRGDGSRRPSKFVRDDIAYITSSQRLADDVHELSLRLGYSPRVFKFKTAENPTIRGRVVKARPFHYSVSINHSAMGYVVHNKEVVPYDGRIWCVSVPETFVVVRRNGIAHMSGNSLEGPHLEAAWIDEAGLMSRVAWDVAQRRTGFAGGQILITTIPYFEGWLRQDIYEAWLNGDPDIEWIAVKTKDNPFYPKEEIERMRRTLRPDKFEIFYEGNWAKPSGLIFPEPDDADLVFDYATEFAWNTGENCDLCHGEVCKGMIPCDWPAFSAHDYGYNAPTTGVWGRLSPDDVLYIVHDYEANEMTIEEHIDVWKSLGLTDIDEGWGDPANPEVWDRARDLDFPIVKGNNNIAAGLDAVYDRLITGRLRIARGCKTLLDHRATYVWATAAYDDSVTLDRPKKPQNSEHLFDALRYLCIGINERGLGIVAPSVLSRRRSIA